MLVSGNLKLNSLDYVLVVDRDYNIVFNTKYEHKVNIPEYRVTKDEYMKRNFFEAYPAMDRSTSSIVECITTGEVIVRKHQKIVDFKGNITWSNNITIPIIRKGMIMGAVELAKDVATVDNMGEESADKLDDFDEIVEAIKNEVSEITFDKILTCNTLMLKSIEKAKMLATMPNPTLIYGETGTGKELFAQAMINYSNIPRSRVVVQNCASVPDNLIESILFGTTKGAYTGAITNKGLFEQADNGILFLDELSAIPYHVQSKLLRVIQDGTFRPLGGNAEKKVNAKIIAAMNVDPVKAMEQKILRDDLFYRFSSSMINLPPLRERLEDLEYYIAHYIAEFNRVYGKNIAGTSDEVMNAFLSYSWDGNVRELKHVIESMVSVTKSDTLEIRDLPAYVYDRMKTKKRGQTEAEQIVMTVPPSEFRLSENFNMREVLWEKEKELIRQALQRTGGNKTEAGKLLGIPRQTLNYKLERMEPDNSIGGNVISESWEFLDADRKLSR